LNVKSNPIKLPIFEIFYCIGWLRSFPKSRSEKFARQCHKKTLNSALHVSHTVQLISLHMYVCTFVTARYILLHLPRCIVEEIRRYVWMSKVKIFLKSTKNVELIWSLLTAPLGVRCPPREFRHSKEVLGYVREISDFGKFLTVKFDFQHFDSRPTVLDLKTS
jgi:hypothetical protein